MTALDTNALSLLFVPGAEVAKSDGTGRVKYAKERLEEWINVSIRAGEPILIGTPVLAETLVKVPPREIPGLVATLKNSPHFRIETFDLACALELADRTSRAIAGGDKREGSAATWTKIKFDRQIITIAIVNGASELISNDPDLLAIGKRWNFKVMGIEDLPLPQSHIPPPLLAPLEEDAELPPVEGEEHPLTIPPPAETGKDD
jgi:hypothetical protein